MASWRERQTGFGRQEEALKLDVGSQPPAHCIAPEPQTPSEEQHGLDSGHGEDVLQAILVICAETKRPGRALLLKPDGKVESRANTPNSVRNSCVVVLLTELHIVASPN